MQSFKQKSVRKTIEFMRAQGIEYAVIMDHLQVYFRSYSYAQLERIYDSI